MKILLFFFINLSITTLFVNASVKKTTEVFKSIQLIDQQNISVEVSKDFVKEAIDQIRTVKDSKVLEIVLTKYIDLVFWTIGDFFAKRSINPYRMPDIRRGFEYYLVSGEIGFINGRLHGLQTIHRGGDIIITSAPTTSNIIMLIVPIAFDELPFMYEYKAKLMDIGPNGKVRGAISKLLAKACFQYDLDTNRVTLNYLRLLNSENIDINFSGYTLIDWILNLFVDIATRVVRSSILLIMELIARKPIQSIVDVINEILRSV